MDEKMSSCHSCTERKISFSKSTSLSSPDGGGGGGTAKASSTPPQGRESRNKRHRRDWGVNDSSCHPYYKPEMRQFHAGLVKLGRQFVIWIDMLARSHETCRAIPFHSVCRLSIFIFANIMVARRQNGQANHLYRQQGGYKTLAVATFWMAIKFIAPRQALPSASFMNYVTGVDKGALIEVELAALEEIRWDVCRIARQAGLINLAD